MNSQETKPNGKITIPVWFLFHEPPERRNPEPKPDNAPVIDEIINKLRQAEAEARNKRA